jgi:hypothetical protein
MTVTRAEDVAAAEDASALPPGPRWRRVVQRPRLRRTLPLAAIVLFAALLVTLHVRTYTQISPLDEPQHMDYALRLSHGELVRSGDRFGAEMLHEEGCRGIDSVPSGYQLPCDEPIDLDQYPLREYNTAEAHPPVYYAITGVGGRLLDRLPGVHSPLTGARLVGVLWLGAGMILLWFVLAELQVGVAVRVAMLVLVASAPAVIHASSTVNPDGSALVVGAATLLVVLRWESGRASPWLLGLVATVAALTKATNVIAVGIGVIYILCRAWQARSLDRSPAAQDGEAPSRRTRSPIAVVLAALGVAVFFGLAWVAVTSVRARVPRAEIPMSQMLHADSISVANILDNGLAGFSPLRDPHIPDVLESSLLTLTTVATDRLMIAGVIAGLLVAGSASRVRALAIAALVAMLTMGPLLVLFDFVATSAYFVIPSRYGLSIVPFAAAVGAATFDRTRGGRWIVSSAAALAGVALLAALV